MALWILVVAVALAATPSIGTIGCPKPDPKENQGQLVVSKVDATRRSSWQEVQAGNRVPGSEGMGESVRAPQKLL